MLIDLQLHSTYSDGYLSPSELVNFISRHGVKIAALTDHNTTAGLYEFRAACEKKKIKSVTGIELYVKLNSRKMNLLWFNFDDTNEDLHNLLRESQVRRRASVRKILQKLLSIGLKFDLEKMLDKFNHYIPINHIVSNVLSTGHNLAKIKREIGSKNPREEEIIRRFFTNREIGVLRESYVNIERIFKLRKKIGGQLILCHPAKYYYLKKDVLLKLKKMGLDGVEILSPHHSYGAVVFLQHLAREFGFIETGGSDFHRFEGSNFPVQNSWDYFEIDSKYLSGIKKIIG